MNQPKAPPQISVKLRHSIATRLLKLVFCVYIVVAMIITAVHMVMNYQKAKQDIYQEVKSIHQTFEPGLAKALWDVNITQLSSSLNGMINLSYIGKILLFETNISSQKQTTVPLLELTKQDANIQSDNPLAVFKSSIQYRFDEQVTHVGNIIIYLDNNAVFSRVEQGYYIIVISAIIKSIALWIIFLCFSRVLLHQPLTKLTEHVVGMDLDKEGSEQIDIGVNEKNELSVLNSAFRQLVIRLKESRALLKNSNQRLEEKVKLRTAELNSKNHELRELNLKLEEASTTDSLTGFRNRRYLNEHIEYDIELILRYFKSKEYLRAGYEKTPAIDLVFYFVDIDHFKQINDEHGHKAGDLVLIQLCNVLRKMFRKSDYMVRWGGEEFLIISRFVYQSKASILAERVRKVIETHDFDIGLSKKLNITCSIGFSTFPFDIQQPKKMKWKEVVQIADKALYAAKKSGRNSWVGVTHQADSCQQISFKALLESTELENIEGLNIQSSFYSIDESKKLSWG